MDHRDPETRAQNPKGSPACESLSLSVRWVDEEGSVHLTSLSDGAQLLYVAHFVRLLGSEAPSYPEPAVEESGMSSPHLMVRWHDGD